MAIAVVSLMWLMVLHRFGAYTVTLSVLRPIVLAAGVLASLKAEPRNHY
jgi:hypothetical protein